MMNDPRYWTPHKNLRAPKGSIQFITDDTCCSRNYRWQKKIQNQLTEYNYPEGN
jgi:hypothetical protein